MAVIAPDWTVKILGGWTTQKNIEIYQETALNGYAAICGSCLCKDSLDAECRALAMAVLLSYDILRYKANAKITILSDCLTALDWIMLKEKPLMDPMLQSLRNLWLERRVFLGKVKGHVGNPGNEVADYWAKKIRRKKSM